MELLAEEAQVEAWFGLFGDSTNLDASRCTVCMGHTICLKIDLDASDGTPSDVCYMESRFVRLETVLVSVQDRCTVYA